MNKNEMMKVGNLPLWIRRSNRLLATYITGSTLVLEFEMKTVKFIIENSTDREGAQESLNRLFGVPTALEVIIPEIIDQEKGRDPEQEITDDALEVAKTLRQWVF